MSPKNFFLRLHQKKKKLSEVDTVPTNELSISATETVFNLPEPIELNSVDPFFNESRNIS